MEKGAHVRTAKPPCGECPNHTPKGDTHLPPKRETCVPQWNPVQPGGAPQCSQMGAPWDHPPQRWDGIDPRIHLLTPDDPPVASVAPLTPFVSSLPLPALTCPPKSHYQLCARTCEHTCAGVSAPPPCTERCFEGCQCAEGLLFDGARCVLPGTCGCLHQGRYFQVGAAPVPPSTAQFQP